MFYRRLTGMAWAFLGPAFINPSRSFTNLAYRDDHLCTSISDLM
jgi:hypothetical protein